MKCIDKLIRQTAAVLLGAAFVLSSAGCGKKTEIPNSYQITSSIYGLLDRDSADISENNHFLSSDLCVVNEDVDVSEVDMSLAEAAGLFNISDKQVLYAKNVHERLYPASTTKIMTAYVVLKYGKLEDTVTVRKEHLELEEGSSHCGLREGDVISVKDLLYGMMLRSGNDAANVLADYISGGTAEFAGLMNEEAKLIGATNSHFVNAHGLHDTEHYTTVYDLYLIFQKALEYETFREITGSVSYIPSYCDQNGQQVSVEWKNTMQYFTGNKIAPDKVTVTAGKTGTTSDALSCLVLLSENEEGKEFVSVILKSKDRGVLYEEMNDLLEEINK